jgi:hypothetical protein
MQASTRSRNKPMRQGQRYAPPASAKSEARFPAQTGSGDVGLARFTTCAPRLSVDLPLLALLGKRICESAGPNDGLALYGHRERLRRSLGRPSALARIFAVLPQPEADLRRS